MKNQRRDFINKGIKTLAKAFINNELPEELNQKEKIKMLTADGKLVEVDPDHISKKSRASNHEILNWLENRPAKNKQ